MCSHMLKIVGSYFVPDCREFRYFRYMDLNVNKAKLSCENINLLVNNTCECDVSITGDIMRY